VGFGWLFVKNVETYFCYSKNDYKTLLSIKKKTRKYIEIDKTKVVELFELIIFPLVAVAPRDQLLNDVS